MRRRKVQKLIPDADTDFAMTGQAFASTILRDPGKYYLTNEAAGEIESAVKAFRSALAKSTHRATRNMHATIRKNEARQAAEKVIRKYARIIRADDRISRGDKLVIRVNEWEKRARPRGCPQTQPMLSYTGSQGPAGDGKVIHVISFSGTELMSGAKASGATNVRQVRKPTGAARLEVFVGLVPPGEPIPETPEGGARYLRSYTKSPMKVELMPPSTPMMIVYWARWASNAGDYGPFSATCVARVEGWSQSRLGMTITPVVKEARRIGQQSVSEDRRLAHAPGEAMLIEQQPSTTTTVMLAVKRERATEGAQRGVD